MKKDLEEYEKELDTLWELYQTACEKQMEESEMNNNNGKTGVLLNFIKKKVEKSIYNIAILDTMRYIGFSCFIAGVEMEKRKQNKPDGGKETEKCGK